MTNVLLVFPSFNPNSFWSFRGACEVWGAHWPAPPLGLITVAALLPQSWICRLVDRNSEELTDEHWAWADLVMTGGMRPQQPDVISLIERARALGKPICIGGPDATSSPHFFADANFLVLGEAENIIDEFVAAWDAGIRTGRFEAAKFQVDVTKTPVPRYDLLNFKNYLYPGVQFSRGCPFNCEFCDIIELYGQVPRAKTNDQILQELDRLYELGHRGHVDFVDDNLIGNKKALKRLLPKLQAWQEQRNYPFKFSTEASINLADDAELLMMMRAANFFAVFIGIESPDTKTLLAAQKKQNTRRALQESIFTIYSAGIFVLAGFIIGFDTDGDEVADAMADCIDATSIPVCMVGLLTALPNTQLTRRLEGEGRLYPGYDEVLPDHGDQCTGGLNFIPTRPRRGILEDYKQVLAKVYEPEAFFKRVSKAAQALKAPARGWSAAPATMTRDLLPFGRLVWRLLARDRALIMPVLRCLSTCDLKNLLAIEYVLMMTALYLHLGSFASHVIAQLERQIRAIDAGEYDEPSRANMKPTEHVPEKLVDFSEPGHAQAS